MLSRKALLRAGAVLVAAAAVVSGCSSASSGSAGKAASSTTTDIEAIKVTGKVGDTPKVDVPTPFSTEKTTRKILTAGDGAKVTAGQRVSIDYLGINGADGKQFDSNYDGDTSAFTLDAGQVIKGMVTGLVGAPIGSRVLITIPPADGYGTQGVSAAGIGPTDTLIFVVDIEDAADVLKRATGKKIAAKKGLPTVKLDKTGAPTITLPDGKASDSLVVQPLIEGTGAKVAKGQTITVQYTGVVWPGGKVFDSSWAKGSPASFEIGAGRVISGWDKGLVGKKVGSQVLLVIPPDEGYGAEGQSDAGIKGTDTLVFVVDILDTTG
ncbi:FKBP-type peptidyl-prolyl cis-trans isomerase [Kineosporia sp. NBRC 101731]|uniref:FKBP-type peptidyl-prolyl cis-trans isomerase n=1 Tax=Kineosporia sp. NBRC 101731 TaxID=3032199 RepID=UPI0024A04977|nr:FKBP-type peptidyl-prolyl cis-trans isomerase [Kineosporia sp. NBRC 101731]GLY31833.1 peptidylprolyl isomerase [Kineosporia sp. NBRC 101731]